MQLCRYYMPPLGMRVGVIIEGEVYDITEAEPGRARTLGTLLGRIVGFPPGGFARWVEERVEDKVAEITMAELDTKPDNRTPHLLAPIDNQEVWAAGVTYKRSVEAREAESGQSGVYDRVYSAARPELFFKANPHHVVGPHTPIRVRSDSKWSVPEPELALVMDSRGTLVGYTIGNDVSARDIEGENPLYLPQAKVYNQACALGPVITLADGFDGATAKIAVQIQRQGATVFEGETSADRLKRSFSELMEYLWRENEYPNGVILLTGTGVVPPDDFTLQDGDHVSITIPGIGTLSNPVVQRT
jgi:2-dehydro-3-deoxy-D-arabinonate dehydratase